MDLILTWAGFRYLLPHMFSSGNGVLFCKDGNVGKVQETLLDVNWRQSDFAQTLHAPLCKIRTLVPLLTILSHLKISNSYISDICNRLKPNYGNHRSLFEDHEMVFDSHCK